MTKIVVIKVVMTNSIVNMSSDMAKKSTVPKPTNAEFKILSVIWDRQSATVREVLNHLVPRTLGQVLIYRRAGML